MNCPNCGQRTIGFFRWSWSFNSWLWTCPHCGAHLRCNRTTIGWLVVQLLALVPLAVFYAKTTRALVMDTPTRDFVRVVSTTSLICGAIAIAVVMVFSCLRYHTGGYVVRGTDKKPAMPQWRRRLWVIAGVVVAAIIVGLATGIYMMKPVLDATACYKQGEAEYKKKKYDQAIADFTKAIQHYPKFGGAYNYRALCYIERAEYDKALPDLNEALRIEPKHASAHTNRGYVYYAQGDFDKAIVEFTEAIELSPKVASRWASRAYAHGQKAEHDKAIADFTEAIRLKPEISQYYADRGNAYFYKGDFAKALGDFDRAQRLERENGETEDEEE
jgi:Flp pilus assembly protein TadD